MQEWQRLWKTQTHPILTVSVSCKGVGDRSAGSAPMAPVHGVEMLNRPMDHRLHQHQKGPGVDLVPMKHPGMHSIVSTSV
jgi:hypothetical protein